MTQQLLTGKTTTGVSSELDGRGVTFIAPVLRFTGSTAVVSLEGKSGGAWQAIRNFALPGETGGVWIPLRTAYDAYRFNVQSITGSVSAQVSTVGTAALPSSGIVDSYARTLAAQALAVAQEALALAQSGGGTPPATPTGIARFAAAEERFPNYPMAPNAAYALTNCSRYGRHIGSGDRDGIQLVSNNCYLWLGDVESPGNTKTIVNTFVEITGKTSQRVTWAGGANGLTEADGSYNTKSDVLLPAAFGLDHFAEGTEIFIRCEATIPANGKMVTVENWDNDDVSGHVFDHSAVQCTNIDGTGDLTYTGSVLFASQSFTPIVVGTFKAAGDPVVALCAGDSVANGVGDTPTGTGRGFFGRALAGTSWSTCIAGCNASRSSGNAQAWQSAPALAALAAYANVLVEEYGTNSFDNTANADPSTVNYIAGLSKYIWTTCKANASQVAGAKAFKVIRTKLMPRTITPTDNTPTAQVVYGPKWDAAGNVDDFNTAVTTDAGIDGVFSWDALTRAASPDQHKWLNGLASTADGTHPVDTIHIAAGSALRTQLLAI